MSDLCVGIIGPFTVVREGSALRLRTRSQALLVARLTVGPVSRDEIARRLWPEAVHSNALTYLRRARQELRNHGVEVSNENGVLRLESHVCCDVDAARRTGTLAELVPNAACILAGFEGELVAEIREIVWREVARDIPPRTAASPADDAYAVVGRLLVRSEPDATATHLIRHWESVKYRASPSALLDLAVELLATLGPEDPRRAEFSIHAGWNAYLLTRHGQARRWFDEALTLAERAGDLATASRTLTNLAAVEMAESQWSTARAYADRAIEIGARSGDPGQHARALFNAACLSRQLLQLDRAVAEFGESLRLLHVPSIAADSLRNYRANLVYLAHGFGAEIFPLPPNPDIPASEHGYSAYTQATFDFWTTFGTDDRGTARTAARLLTVSSAGGMENEFAHALDSVACLFGRRGLGAEAAACVRLSGRFRRALGGRRGPGDRYLIRRHAPGPYLGLESSSFVAAWCDEDFAVVASRIVTRLATL